MNTMDLDFFYLDIFRMKQCICSPKKITALSRNTGKTWIQKERNCDLSTFVT